MKKFLAAILAVVSLAAMSRPPVTPLPPPAAAQASAEARPSTALKGRLVQEGPAERSQTVLRTEDGARWAIDCLPAAVLQQLLGKTVELEGVPREAPALLGMKRLCVHKVVVPPEGAGRPSVDSILLSPASGR